MQMDWYQTDDKGRFIIDGITIKIKESEKSKYFRMAMRNYPRANAFIAVGVICLIAGFFITVGIVGRMELLSISKELDSWNTLRYVKICAVDLVLLLLGGLSVKRGMKLAEIYDKWIDDYFE